jgi:hypothetical protein
MFQIFLTCDICFPERYSWIPEATSTNARTCEPLRTAYSNRPATCCTLTKVNDENRDAEDDCTLQVTKVKVRGIRYSTSRSPHLDILPIILQRNMGLSSCLFGSEVRTLDTNTTVAVMIFHLQHVLLDGK